MNTIGSVKIWLITGLLCCTLQVSLAQKTLNQTQLGLKTSGDVLRIAMPALALGSTMIWKDGQQGGLQFTKVLGSTLVLTTSLKYAVNKTRPDGGNYSFPSGHTSVAFASAAFVQRRYGWKYGIPAYLLAGYVGHTRIAANKHDKWDVIAGAAIGVGMGYLFTKGYQKNKNLKLTLGAYEGAPTIGFTYKF